MLLLSSTEQKFREIVFLAISQIENVRGHNINVSD